MVGRIFWAVWLGACVEAGDPLADAQSTDDGVVLVAADEGGQAPPPPLAAGYLEFGVNAFDQGEAVNLKVRGASPGDVVQFLRGSGYGVGGCPALISPLCLQIGGPVQSIGSAVANAQGVATYSFNMPAVGLNQTVGLQAVVQSPGAKASEGWERTIRANGSTAPYALGAGYTQNTVASVSPDAILAHTIEITEAVSVAGFSCRTSAATGRFKSALYADNNGAPGALVAQSRPANLVVGVSQAPNNMPANTLQPGRYWQATIFEQGANTWANTLSSNNPEWIILQSFSSPFPANWVGGNFYQSPRIDCAVAVQ